jgi:hypothetical protein
LLGLKLWDELPIIPDVGEKELFMSSAISSSVSNSVSSASPAGAGPSLNSATAQPTNLPSDTVTLTEAQQVYQLHLQGQKISQIASTLSLPVDLVNSYLENTSSGNISNGS